MQKWKWISRVTGTSCNRTKRNYVSRTQFCTCTERDDLDLLFNVKICLHLK